MLIATWTVGEGMEEAGYVHTVPRPHWLTRCGKDKGQLQYSINFLLVQLGKLWLHTTAVGTEHEEQA